MSNLERTSGFTLLEILVTLALIGLLAGSLVPTILNQLTRGETSRIVEDLSAIEVAAKSFRVDLQRWPRRLDNFVAPVTGSEQDLNGSIYSPGLQARWRGPYLERGAIPGDTLPTGSGGVILSPFQSASWGSTSFITVRVKGISHEEARRVSLMMDGDTAVASTGRVRWRSGQGTQPDTLIFYAAPASQ